MALMSPNNRVIKHFNLTTLDCRGVRLELTTVLPATCFQDKLLIQPDTLFVLRRAKGSHLHLKFMRTVLAGSRAARDNKPIFTCSPFCCPGKIRTRIPRSVALYPHPLDDRAFRVMHEARTHKHKIHNLAAKPVCVTSPYVPGAGFEPRIY